MDIYFKFSFFFGFITSLFIALFVYLKNKKSIINKTFSLMSLCGAIWSFGFLGMIFSSNINSAIFWRWFMESGSILLPIFLLHFVYSVLKINKQRVKHLVFFYFTASVLWILNLVDFFGISVFTKDMMPKYIFSFYPTAGPGYYIFFVYFSLLILYSLIELYRGYKVSTGFKASQIKYIILAVSVGFGGGGMTFFLTLGIPIPAYGIIFFSFYPLVIAYAVVKYRLMDIRAIVFRSIVFGSIILILTATFSVVSSFIAFSFSSLIGFRSDIISGIVVAIMVAIGYRPIVNLVERLTNKFLFKKTYDSDELLSKIADISARIIQLKKLSQEMHKALEDAFKFEKFAIAMINNKGGFDITFKDGFIPGVAEKLAIYPDAPSVLEKELKRRSGLLVIDEMFTAFENGEFTPVDEKLLLALHDVNISVVVPLFVKNTLIGVMVLGSKKSGDPYSHQDIKVIEIIGGQVAVAIDNARLYDELRYFNLKLEKEVEEKTQQLQRANVDLQKLDQAKSEFISIASHQLRTPLTVIKGYISMMKEGSFGKIRPQISESLDKVYISNERLIQLVENLLDISRIESGRQEFIWKKIQLEDLAAEVTDKLQGSAKKKKLNLAFHKPEKKLPPIVIDDGKIHEVMMNFVDNAIKYTAEGQVDVYVKEEPQGMLTFCVKDTGKGISKEGKDKLFKKFSRGKDSFRQHTEGLGLGLYVATMMMRAHEGKIWADSPGEGKGASFCFSLPVNGKHKDGDTSKIDEKIVKEVKAEDQKEAKENIPVAKSKKKAKKSVKSKVVPKNKASKTSKK